MELLDSSKAQACLAHITHIYTDVDGTLLAPGGRLLTNQEGKPSFALARALVNLKEAGIEVIIVTGRDSVSCTEIIRLANFNQFIAEMGCVVQHGYGAHAQKNYNLGDWVKAHYNHDITRGAELTPYEVIIKSGALEMLLQHFRGKLEVHALRDSYRDVTLILRGSVDTSPGGTVEKLLSQLELPLQLIDNGIIYPQSHGLVGVEDVHIYHLMPRGTGKGFAVKKDMDIKQLEPKQVVSLGDAASDLEMGLYTGSFVLVDNKKNSAVQRFTPNLLSDIEHLYVTTLPNIGGWLEFAEALIRAKAKL